MMLELGGSILGPDHSNLWTAESYYPSSTAVSFKCPRISESKTVELEGKELQEA